MTKVTKILLHGSASKDAFKLTAETEPAWVVTSPAATAAGEGDESGEEVSDETCGICISCLM